MYHVYVDFQHIDIDTVWWHYVTVILLCMQGPRLYGSNTWLFSLMSSVH